MEKINIISAESEYKVEEILNCFGKYFRDFHARGIDKSLFAKKIYENGKLIYAEKNDEIIAFAAFYCNDMNEFNGYITLIAVNEKNRKSGIGSELIHEVIEISKKCGMRHIRLEVYKDNISAVHFYEKNGFKKEKDNENTYYMIFDI